MAARDAYLEMRSLIISRAPVIIDGGAHLGDTALKFVEMWPAAKVFSFEANPELIEALKKRTALHPGIKVFANALGAENGTIRFNVTQYDGAASMFTPHETLKKYHGAKSDIKATPEVPMVRLDRVITEPDIDIMHLDLQGFEMKALEGAGGLLKNTKLVYTEIEFTELYNDQPLFSHIDLFLRPHGFRLLNFYNLWTHPDGQLTSGDALYLNTRYF